MRLADPERLLTFCVTPFPVSVPVLRLLRCLLVSTCISHPRSRFVNVVATFGGRKRGPNSKPAE